LKTSAGATALNFASFCRHGEVVKILLKAGARETRLSCLAIAILRDYRDIVQLFVEHGDQVHPSAQSVARSAHNQKHGITHGDE
jgi:ankyrin repeat protein